MSIYKFVCLFTLIGIVPISSDLLGQKKTSLHIFYIADEPYKGLADQMKGIYTSKIFDSSVNDNNDTSYFFYISDDRDDPIYLRNISEIRELIKDLPKQSRRIQYNASNFDINKFRHILYKDDLGDYESIIIDAYVSAGYISNQIILAQPNYLLSFFPKELQFMSKERQANMQVNIFYPKNSNFDYKSVRNSLSFLKNEFEIKITYKFYEI